MICTEVPKAVGMRIDLEVFGSKTCTIALGPSGAEQANAREVTCEASECMESPGYSTPAHPLEPNKKLKSPGDLMLRRQIIDTPCYLITDLCHLSYRYNPRMTK